MAKREQRRYERRLELPNGTQIRYALDVNWESANTAALEFPSGD